MILDPFEPAAPTLDELLLQAIAQLPNEWSVAAHRLLIEIPEDLRVFLLRACPTSTEYVERLSDTRRAARRQLRRWGYKPEVFNDSRYMFERLDCTRDTIRDDCRSAWEILTAKLVYRSKCARLLATQAYLDFSLYLKRLSHP